MTYPPIEHLAHVQADIVRGIKMETKESILAKYSITDQLNAKGTVKTAMQTAIDVLITTGASKQVLWHIEASSCGCCVHTHEGG